MSAITPGDNHGTLNDTTPVTAVAAPGASVYRAVRFLCVYNRDTVAQAITLIKRVASTDYYIDSNPSVNPGQSWRPIDGNDVFIINGTTESLRLVMGGAKTTTEPDFTACWVDRS